MKRRYRWRCFACDEANAPSATSCASCGFPARASGVEIERARSARAIGLAPALQPATPASESIRTPRPKWSSWRKGIAIAGVGLVAIGALAWRESFAWPGFALALLALMFGALLLLVACVPREPQLAGP